MQTLSPDTKYLSPKSLAARWDGVVTIKTLSLWRFKKRGPAFVHIGRQVAYPIEAVEAFEAEFPKTQFAA